MMMTTTLTYRGVQYDYVPPAVRTEATDVVAKYRGWNYHCTRAVNPPAQPVRDLIYRGVVYRTGQTEAVNTTATTAANTAKEVNMPALDLNQLSRVILTHHHQVIKNREQSLLTRMIAQMGLPAAAGHYWNQIQGKIKPHVWTSYDRSHATMS
ncbi:DUF4278 domain-containing protein [Thermosynechococcus sp. GLH187]|uniref:DUF4278 domain-containing protein n=2 Tax=unclassified Thermosynechococcus TaxID=2622553 RepID=UPI002877F159|nr:MULTISPECIES: DUF4278 domain-containing protein [unclassified Thermosynechococcus]WNC44521.1 DUF4278 domain-containing protein [Thermosynechococcus sp. GLH187]WNC47057.1 DUF4278 domain-containing protein [Thermosynechococcus sp. GLH333]WNC49594.1 DUF4278 domain-containing protein [Thermosynechococcus sp. GLH87]